MQHRIKKIKQINKQKVRKQSLEMGKNLKQELLKIAQSITTNIHYPCNLGNINILFEYEFYFDICQIIFPNISIQLVKIREDSHLEPGEKMEYLVALLQEETQYDISSIKGQQIIRGENISHLYRFLQVLEKFSEIYQAQENQDDNNSSRRVRSDPNTSSRLEDEKKKPSMSARQNIKKQTISESEDEQEIPKPSENVKRRKQKKVPSYSAAKKQMRTRSETCKNLYNSLVNIMMTQKNRAIKASLRDNRKNQNQQIIAAKNKYKSYLLNYAKQNRAQRNRRSFQKPHKKAPHQLPLQQFSNIQNFFKSFQLKLRDQKHTYLTRIQKLIQAQQRDRLCYLNKLQQQQNAHIKKQTKKQIQKIENQHRVRSTLLKQEFQSQKQANKVMKKQYERNLRVQRKELKQNKKRELQKINDFMRQQNGKVLGSLEEGGRLEKVILDMYKRF